MILFQLIFKKNSWYYSYWDIRSKVDYYLWIRQCCHGNYAWRLLMLQFRSKSGPRRLYFLIFYCLNSHLKVRVCQCLSTDPDCLAVSQAFAFPTNWNLILSKFVTGLRPLRTIHSNLLLALIVSKAVCHSVLFNLYWWMLCLTDCDCHLDVVMNLALVYA